MWIIIAINNECETISVISVNPYLIGIRNTWPTFPLWWDKWANNNGRLSVIINGTLKYYVKIQNIQSMQLMKAQGKGIHPFDFKFWDKLAAVNYDLRFELIIIFMVGMPSHTSGRCYKALYQSSHYES